ncbi:MAG: hypothetical protein MUE50_16610 [Pirellulaceae bacterium]|nr:hypothetical protein [Pirellulaceae bacterium]
MNFICPYRPLSMILAGMLVCALVGCAPQDQPRRNPVPQEETPESAPNAGTTVPSEARPASEASRLACDTPQGWTPGSTGGMRKLAFEVQDGERKVEITAIDLAVSAGGLLPNVNRWRGQIQLSEITQEDLDKAVKPIPVAGVEGQYVELVGPKDADPRQAILGVVALLGERAWFFKLSGDADLALREKERFAEFVKSVRFVTPAQAGSTAVATTPAGGESRLVWDAPDGWLADEAGGMGRAAFHVTEGDQNVEINVLELAGSVEMLLPNVNRWRRQIQLEEITQTELEKTVTPIQVAGMEGHYVELLGPEDAQPRPAALRVVVSHQGKTWLFNMTGDADMVLREKERFLGFVRSARFGPAGTGEKAEPAREQ